MRLRFAVLLAGLLACEVDDDPIDEALIGTALGPTGGFVTSNDGIFTAVFPPGALYETVVITVRSAEGVPESLGNAYSVQGAVAIATPVYLEYRFTLAQIEGHELDAIGVARANGRRWEPLVRVDLDEHTQTVTASDTALANAYGLVAGEAALADEEAGSSDDGGETSDPPTTSDDAPTRSTAD
jgi:hypothetical protein